MAVKKPGRDIDDAHAERFHERRMAEALGEAAPPTKSLPRPRSPQRPAPPVSAARLAFDDAHRRARHGAEGLELPPPSLADAAEALLDAEDGEDSPLALSPVAAARAAELPEPELRPPPFLNPLEAMRDVYLRVRGRASPRTRRLLEGPDLDDLLEGLAHIAGAPALHELPASRVAPALRRTLGEELGPLLAGFGDARLVEPWRLFLDGWDLWVPEGYEEGVELFWEGEGAHDDGAPLEIVQSLAWLQGEALLSTRVGDAEDELVFDGERFYRLETERPPPR